MNLPTVSPAEVLVIDPESLEVANCFLTTQSLSETSNKLNISIELATRILDRREVKAYIDSVFRDCGFNNRFKLRQVMDAVLDKKLEELYESDTGSGKDIIEIIAMSHKMSMDNLDREIKLEEAKNKTLAIRNQVNVQINNPTTKYESLMQKLLDKDVIDADD